MFDMLSLRVTPHIPDQETKDALRTYQQLTMNLVRSVRAEPATTSTASQIGGDNKPANAY
jgi:hypothetical protein